jgi:hypothetical protein
MSHYYLNEDHTYRPCGLLEWSAQLEKLSKGGLKHVGHHVVEGRRVSTVWLGLDHNDFGGRPHVFETMVFDENGSDIYCTRYTTWEEAEEGHIKALDWVLGGRPDE